MELAEGDKTLQVQETKIRALLARLDQLEIERRGRVYENKEALGEVTGQLCDLHALLDCHSGRVEAHVNVQSARAGTQHDDVYARLRVLEEKRGELRERIASKVQLQTSTSCSHTNKLLYHAPSSRAP